MKKRIKEDEKNYYEYKFGSNLDIKQAWATENANEKGEPELVESPRKLACMFNKFFIDKLKNHFHFHFASNQSFTLIFFGTSWSLF